MKEVTRREWRTRLRGRRPHRVQMVKVKRVTVLMLVLMMLRLLLLLVVVSITAVCHRRLVDQHCLLESSGEHQ